MSTTSVKVIVAQAGPEPVAQLLDRAVSEMRDLTSVVNELEALVGNLVLAGSFSTSNSIYDLQKLDLLRQNIGGIADFLDGIRLTAHPGWAVDTDLAAAPVKLADLSARLRGVSSESYAATGDADCFELFGDDMSKVA